MFHWVLGDRILDIFVWRYYLLPVVLFRDRQGISCKISVRVQNIVPDILRECLHAREPYYQKSVEIWLRSSCRVPLSERINLVVE